MPLDLLMGHRWTRNLKRFVDMASSGVSEPDKPPYRIAEERLGPNAFSRARVRGRPAIWRTTPSESPIVHRYVTVLDVTRNCVAPRGESTFSSPILAGRHELPCHITPTIGQLAVSKSGATGSPASPFRKIHGRIGPPKMCRYSRFWHVFDYLPHYTPIRNSLV